MSTPGEQEEVLVHLQRHGPKSVEALQETCALSPGQVSAAVKALIKDGACALDDGVVFLHDGTPAEDGGGGAESVPVELTPLPAPAPTGALTVGAMLAALQGDNSGLAFRAEVELIPQADGTVALGRVIKVLGLNLNGRADG